MSNAVIVTGYGPPTVLRRGEIEVGEPAARQIRVAVRFAGVGPTDLAIRAGRLRQVYPLRPGSVLGFEAAGVVDAVGSGVVDVSPGDDVAVFMPVSLGGYAELVTVDHWVRKPPSVGWEAAAALPASGEAAVRVLNQLDVAAGETLLVLGGVGSVGMIAVQLAVARGADVLAAVRPDDFDLVEQLAAVPIDYHRPLAEAAAAVGDRVDAVLDASGRGDLQAAIALAGGARRVVTLSSPDAAQLGVTLSGPIAADIGGALREVMGRLAEGGLRLQDRVVADLWDAADVHARLERGELRRKVVLAVGDRP